MSEARFEPNLQFDAMFNRSTFLVGKLEEVAKEIVAHAEAPVDTGAYLAGVHAVAGVEGDGAEAAVVATDWKSGLIEFGDGHRTLAPLRHAAEAAGYPISGGEREAD